MNTSGSQGDTTRPEQAQADPSACERQRDEFLAVLAHELRTPLAPLRDSLRLFERAHLTDPALIAARRIMQRQTSQMARLIDDLLDISHISRNRLELRTENLSVLEPLESAIETCRPALNAARHQLTIQVPSGEVSVRVHADRIRLAQVFGNILTNSTKYMAAGGEIRIGVTSEAGWVSVSISDTGVGIAEEDLPRIFEMFTQVGRDTERRTGLGIGLALVKHLITLHGGQIAAESGGIGQGTTLTVRLPLTESPATALGAMAVADVPSEGSGRDGRRRVLVTDDNEDSATALALLLTDMGNEVRIARDGREALEIAARFRPDLILMDVGMPGLDGLTQREC